MAPSRRKSKASAAAAVRRQWKVGDLVLAKVKGFPAWPATVSEPEKWGYSADWKKVLVYFFGTKQIAFCNHADVEAFTEEKKDSLLGKRQGKGADYVRAVKEIIESFEKSKKKDKVDDLNADEVIRTHVGNSEDSLPGSRLRDQTETSSGTFISQRDVASPTTDVVTNASHERDTLSDEPIDNAANAETNVATIYSSREISESIQPSSVKQRRSRSSSRSRNSTIPSNDGGKNFKGMGSHLLMNRTLRRNKQIKRPADALEIGGACSPVLVCNDSIEDNGSEIVTVDSDTTSFNEGSTLEYGNNIEHVESVECLEEGAELGKKLEFPIKAVVMKKKRKQKRNRVSSDAPEHTGLLDKVPDWEGETRTSNHDLSKIPAIVCERLTKEDGDEHLPLVKRARVRMGKQCVLGEKADGFIKMQDDSSKEVPVGGPVYPSLNCAGDNSVNRISVVAKEDAVNSSPSNTCFHSSDNKPFGSENRKNQSFFSLDGEATLPPSKRLHRALEAMSANVVEDGTPVTNGSCNSPVNKYKEMKSENDLGAHYVKSHGHNPVENHTSQIFNDVNPCTFKVNEMSPVDADNWIQPVISSNSSDEFQSPSIVPAMMKHQFFPGPDGRPAISRCNNQDILVQFSPKNEKQCANIESSHHKAEFQAGVAQSSESTEMNTDHVSETDANTKVPHQNGMTGHCHSKELTLSDKTECLKIPCDDKSQIDAMCENVNEDNNNQVFENTEKASTTILDEKTLSRAAPISDDCLVEKDANDVQSIPSPADGSFVPERSPPSYTSLSRTTNTLLQNNGCSSSKDQIHGNINKSVHTMYIDEEKSESAVTSVGKSNHDDDADADVCLTSFETTLAALTRTKESIGRATRIAIDCFKYGTASKVVDILLRYLENEPSLPKRVDLFFLVDSITQCSRGFKGDVRGMFPSAIQSVLPRLLAAAAPPGNTARENRRQCLKVLRLWLDRRIFPESIVRQHMRHLDSLNWSASAGTLSRRPQRNERAFDDPLREMEGMLVDEYGSNSSFQIPGFSMPHTVKVKEDNGSDSDGGSFEAVTPEHNSETPEEREPTPTARKHRHILEDVDGELEMEDVSPSSEAVMCDIIVHEGNNTLHIPNHEQHIPSSSLTPQLPEYLPLLSPPLPTSPPPPPPPLPPPAPVPGTCTNGGDANLFVGTNNMQSNLQPVTQQEDALRNKPVIPDPLNYQAAERQNFQMETRLRDSTASCSVGNYPVPHVPMGPMTNVPHTDGEVMYNKAYHLPPPPPPSTSSSQFSYAHHTDRHVQSWRDPPFPDYNSRHHYPPNNDGGHYYTDHDRSIPREFNERWRYPGPSFSGPVHPRDRASYPSAPDPYIQGGPSRIRNQGWNYPPQETNYRRSMPREAPRYWPPR